MASRWDVSSSNPSPSGPANTPASPSLPSINITRKHVLGVLGAGALVAAGVLGYPYRDDIARSGRRALHGIGAFASSVVDGASSPDILPDSPADRLSQAVALVNEDMTNSNNFEVQLATYRIAHPTTYRSDAEYQRLLTERRTRATHILEQASRVLGKDSQSWGGFIERAWDNPEVSALLSTGLIYGIAIALHRSSREIGDANDQDASNVAYQLFSRAGWQNEPNLANVTDAAGLHYGMITNLEREGISSFRVGRRYAPNGSAELVADRVFFTAMVVRLNNIQRVIAEKRTSNQLSLTNVRAALEAIPETSVVLANVPVEVTLAAVWGRLSLPGATVDSEVRRLAVLGGRPITTVLRERDEVGGGLVKAHELVPSEVPDPSRFVVVR